MPCTYEARGEASHTSASANSSGSPTRPNGNGGGLLLEFFFRGGAVGFGAAFHDFQTRSVRVQPGAMALTRMPCGPSSFDSVLSRPITAMRTEFDSSRFSTGCLTDRDVIATIVPRCGGSFFSRWGRAA